MRHATDTRLVPPAWGSKRSRFLPLAVAAGSQNDGRSSGKRGSDLLWRLDEMQRRYESARGCRGSSSLSPLIVVRREVQQSSLGKLICVLRKAATTFGIRLQEVGIHGNPPLNNKLTLAQSHLRRVSQGALKLWINELSARGVRRFYLVSELPAKVGTETALDGTPQVRRRLTHSVGLSRR
jgi:hypothetical protein